MYLLDETYHKCVDSLQLEPHKIPNHVQQLYDLFTHEQISNKVAEIVKPSYVKAEVKVVFQTIDNLHKACPHHKGDWYFSGNYPTIGGNSVVNKAFINFMEGRKERSY
jgi:amidophosphoribosyltransferase